MKKHISATLASVKSLISHGTNRRPNIIHDFTNIGPGGFCDCDVGRQARNFPEGTQILALAMLAYANKSDMGAIYTKGDGKLYVTYTYEFTTDHIDEWAIDNEYLLGAIDDWPILASRRPELAQMVNSATNVFPWDMTTGANTERAKCEHEEIDGIFLLNQDTVVVELGLAPDGSGRNTIKRVLEPGAPGYLRAMQLDAGIRDGTGLIGMHIHPDSAQRTNPQGISP